MPGHDFRRMDFRVQYDAVDTLRYFYNHHRRLGRPRLDIDLADLLLGLIRAQLDSFPIHSWVSWSWRFQTLGQSLLQPQSECSLVRPLFTNLRIALHIPLLHRTGKINSHSRWGTRRRNYWTYTCRRPHLAESHARLRDSKDPNPVFLVLRAQRATLILPVQSCLLRRPNRRVTLLKVEQYPNSLLWSAFSESERIWRGLQKVNDWYDYESSRAHRKQTNHYSSWTTLQYSCSRGNILLVTGETK